MSRESNKNPSNKCLILEIEKRTDVYRKCKLGQTLYSSLKELVDEQKLTPSLANTVLDQFDRSVTIILSDLPCTLEATFRAGEILSYSVIGDQWRIKLKDVMFTFVDQDVEDNINMVSECVIHTANPVPYLLDLERTPID